MFEGFSKRDFVTLIGALIVVCALSAWGSIFVFYARRASLSALSAKRYGCRVFPVIRWSFLNLAGGYPGDHDGGSDHGGGALLAFRTPWHPRPSFSLRPNTPLPTAVYRNRAYIPLPRTLSAEPEVWCRFRNRPAHIHLRSETAQWA
jgi:hypothetical protein